MKLVVDTNVVFSALLKRDSKEIEIFQSANHDIFIPKFLFVEIFKHKEKIVKVSRLSEEEILDSFYSLLKYCTIFDDEDVPESIFHKAFDYVADIDPKDVVFIASALTIDACLWSGDKKLINALKKKGVDFLIQTHELWDNIEVHSS